MSNPLKVREVNGYIEKLLLTNPILSDIKVIGEVSNFRRSGNIVYFNLQDDLKREILRCVSFNAALFNEMRIEDGMRIICTGTIRTYAGQSIYQLNVENLHREGLGQAAERLRILREKLFKEGLFDDRFKRAIPKYAFSVGLITSSQGAAIRDFIKIAHRRNPKLKIIVYPTRVQGLQAAQTVSDGIDIFNKVYPVDVIVITRGGGSVEDLDAFNDESLVRSIFASKTPIVTAVGHERDFTLVDFVSDKRAATPSEAAETVTFDLKELRIELEQKLQRVNRSIDSRWRNQSLFLDQLFRVLKAHGPSRVLETHDNRVQNYKMRIHQKITLQLQSQFNALKHKGLRLDHANPMKSLERGFALVHSTEGMVKTVKEAHCFSHLSLQFIDGSIEVEVKERKYD